MKKQKEPARRGRTEEKNRKKNDENIIKRRKRDNVSITMVSIYTLYGSCCDFDSEGKECCGFEMISLFHQLEN